MRPDCHFMSSSGALTKGVWSALGISGKIGFIGLMSCGLLHITFYMTVNNDKLMFF